MPSVLEERASVAGHGLRFSLSVSFYHAGSKRFYGDTFMGESLDEEDEERVEVVSERRQHPSSTSRKVKGTESWGTCNHVSFVQKQVRATPVHSVEFEEYNMMMPDVSRTNDGTPCLKELEPEMPHVRDVSSGWIGAEVYLCAEGDVVNFGLHVP